MELSPLPASSKDAASNESDGVRECSARDHLHKDAALLDESDGIRDGTARDHLHAATGHLRLACGALWQSTPFSSSSLPKCSSTWMMRTPNWEIVYPSNEWKKRWDLLIMAFIVYESVVIPLRIAFRAEAEGRWWAFELCLSLG